MDKKTKVRVLVRLRPPGAADELPACEVMSPTCLKVDLDIEGEERAFNFEQIFDKLLNIAWPQVSGKKQLTSNFPFVLAPIGLVPELLPLADGFGFARVDIPRSGEAARFIGNQKCCLGRCAVGVGSSRQRCTR